MKGENMKKIEILRLPQVMKRIGVSKSWVYQNLKNGKFPKQIFLSERLVGWVDSDIDDWIKSRIDAE